MEFGVFHEFQRAAEESETRAVDSRIVGSTMWRFNLRACFLVRSRQSRVDRTSARELRRDGVRQGVSWPPSIREWQTLGPLAGRSGAGRYPIFTKSLGPQEKSGGIRLPIAGCSARRTNPLGSVLRRYFCLKIGRRGGAHDTLLLSIVSSVHNPKVMLGMLVKVLCRDPIATRRRLPRESNVPFENLMRRTSNFDVRAVTIEILTSMRYLLPITVGIVTVIATIRSIVLSCSHETFCIDGDFRTRS